MFNQLWSINPNVQSRSSPGWLDSSSLPLRSFPGGCVCLLSCAAALVWNSVPQSEGLQPQLSALLLQWKKWEMRRVYQQRHIKNRVSYLGFFYTSSHIVYDKAWTLQNSNILRTLLEWWLSLFERLWHKNPKPLQWILLRILVTFPGCSYFSSFLTSCFFTFILLCGIFFWFDSSSHTYESMWFYYVKKCTKLYETSATLLSRHKLQQTHPLLEVQYPLLVWHLFHPHFLRPFLCRNPPRRYSEFCI